MSIVNDEQPVTRAEFEQLSAALERLDSKFTKQITEMESHLCRLKKDIHKMFGIKHYVDMAMSAVLGGGCVYALLLPHLLK